MAVCAKDQFTRANIILDHNLVADTLAFPEINVVFFCKVSHLLLGCCCLRAVRRYVVVNDENEFLCICNVRMVQLVFVHIYSQMSSSVIAHQTVKLYRMDIARFDAVYTGCCCDDFFCNCHSHGYFSSLFSEAIRPP